MPDVCARKRGGKARSIPKAFGDDSSAVCGRDEPVLRFIDVRTKRRLTSLAIALFTINALAAGTSATQPASDHTVIGLDAGASPTTGLFLDSLPIAQAPGQVVPQAAPRKEPDIHYVPTPQELVEVMLDMAKVGKDDIVYDLGSGDGRLVITAAKKYGASGVGIDIDPQRIAESRENAKKAAVEDKVRFLEQDLFESDFHDATVVTLYLLGELNLRLRPQIFAQLKPGTRLVSHAFDMGDWEPDAQKTIEINGNSYNAYYWVVPANMSGRWSVSGNKNGDLPRSVTVEQKFQEIAVRSEDGADFIAKGKVNGATFTLVFNKNPDDRFDVFRGKIQGNTIEAAETGDQERQWTATREVGSETPLDAGTAMPKPD
jgi:precorrin-6B methylase 2